MKDVWGNEEKKHIVIEDNDIFIDVFVENMRHEKGYCNHEKTRYFKGSSKVKCMICNLQWDDNAFPCRSYAIPGYNDGPIIEMIREKLGLLPDL